ncbi:MAG: hypothetical protein II649_00445, partial [Kiritimatiellae bacterium]|nr:hypothetical protein [Kiritimatiellia bacterium]
MSLTIETIRSLDAGKSYYIANSTGEIAEATKWQKFKCFLGIGDGRMKANKLLDEVKVALLKASGETDNAALSNDITRYDENHNWKFSLSGRSLAAIANRFVAANASKIASADAKAIADRKIDAVMKYTVSACLQTKKGRQDVVAFLKLVAKPLVDKPPMADAPDGRRVLDRAAFEKAIDELLEKASTDAVQISGSSRLGHPHLDKVYVEHVIATLYGEDGSRDENRTIDDLRPAADVRFEKANANIKLGTREDMRPAVQERIRDLLAAAGENVSLVNVITRDPDRFLFSGSGKLRGTESVQKYVKEWIASYDEMLKATEGNRNTRRAGEWMFEKFRGKKLLSGMVTKMAQSARAIPLKDVFKVTQSSSGLEIHKALQEIYNAVQRVMDEAEATDHMEGQDDLVMCRRFILGCLFEQIPPSTLRHFDAALETPTAAKIKDVYGAIVRMMFEYPDDPSEGLLGNIMHQSGSLDHYITDIKMAAECVLDLPESDVDGEKGNALSDADVDARDIYYAIEENAKAMAKKQLVKFGEIAVKGGNDAAVQLRELCKSTLEEHPCRPEDVFNNQITTVFKPVFNKAVMDTAKKVFDGEPEVADFAQQIGEDRLEVELLGFGKLSADPKEALDQLARFATADQNATFASLDKANKTRVG